MLVGTGGHYFPQTASDLALFLRPWAPGRLGHVAQWLQPPLAGESPILQNRVLLSAMSRPAEYTRLCQVFPLSLWSSNYLQYAMLLGA